MKKILILLISVLLIISFLYYENNAIQITRHRLNYKNLPNEFNNLKIIHISDLHNKSFGKNQKNLIKKIDALAPDMIFITGDLIDSKKYNLNKALSLIDGIKNKYPIYYVNGNHEFWSGKINEIEKELRLRNVNVLNNEKITLNRNNFKIDIIGMNDTNTLKSLKHFSITLNHLKGNNFSLLLAHRANLFNIYVNQKFDLTFSGHEHGGQIRLPFLGGLFSPQQGFFPKYTSGIHKKNNYKVVISRGLGNSIIPQRLFNRPELILVTLVNE